MHWLLNVTLSESGERPQTRWGRETFCGAQRCVFSLSSFAGMVSKLFATKKVLQNNSPPQKVLLPWSNTSSSNPTRTPALVDASLRFSFWVDWSWNSFKVLSWNSVKVLILKLFQDFILKLFQCSDPEPLSWFYPETLSRFWSWNSEEILSWNSFKVLILKLFRDSYTETLKRFLSWKLFQAFLSWNF